MINKYILALLLVLCFATAPVCVYASEHGGGEKKEEKKDDHKKEGGEGGHGEDKKAAPKDVTGGRFAGDPIYIHLSPMILPVINQHGAQQIVTMQITLEVKDFDAADMVHSNMPKVMDALMRSLYGGLGDGTLRNGHLIDVTRVKSKCVTAVGEAIGQDNIKDVLIEAVAQRRL